MRGKNKCKILKEIRQRIADENDIPYVTRECTFQGECKGTCPKCEAELRYLEQQLARRQRLGKTVTVAALAASLMANLTACPDNEKVERKSADKAEGTFFSDTAEPSTDELLGEDTTDITDELGGVPVEESSENTEIGELEFEGEPTETCEIIGEVEATEDITELEGDVAYFEPSEVTDEMLAGMIPASETEPDE